MYQSNFIFKDNLTIEIIKHNGIIIIKDENYNKMRYVDYNLDQAINKFKNQYKWKVENKMNRNNYLKLQKKLDSQLHIHKQKNGLYGCTIFKNMNLEFYKKVAKYHKLEIILIWLIYL